jgi:hypothetical protein
MLARRVFMRREIYAVSLLLASLSSVPPAHAMGDNPKACNCKTLDVSGEEAAGGCPARVKEQTCPLYRDAQTWKERLRQQHEQRRQEKSMEPSNIPRSK